MTSPRQVDHNGKHYIIHSERLIERVDVYSPKKAASHARYVRLDPDSKEAKLVIAKATPSPDPMGEATFNTGEA